MANAPETRIATSPRKQRSPGRYLAALLPLVALGVLGLYAMVRWQHPRQVLEDSAAQHWQEALQALAQDDLLQAQTHLSRCLTVWPLNAEAHFVMARTCRRVDDDSGWQAHWKRAELLGWDKRALALERDLMQAQSGDLRSVEARLQSHLDSLPTEEPLIWESLAKGYLRTDRLDAVLALTRQWSERHPDHWLPILYRARALHLGRSVQRAIGEYERVLKSKPDHAEAHLELAGAFLVNSQFLEAIEHFHAYLEQHPHDAVALVRLADCQLSLGQTEAARESLQRFSALGKEDAAGFFVRGKLELAENKPEEAFRWLRRAETLAPHETDITYNLILVLQQLGQRAEATRYEGKLHELRRQFEELENLKRKIRSQPDNADLRDEAGALALRMGHPEEASHWLRTALQIEPDRPATHKLLAEYYQQRGNPSLADYHRRKSAGQE